jgi:hypothetical protein
MTRRRFARVHWQAGQVMPALAAIMAVLLGFAALGTDVFLIYWTKLNLQRATDSAAVAGATYLSNLSFSGADARCGYSTPAEQAACTYALANDVQPSEIASIVIASGSRSITVTTSRVLPAVFARLLGYSQFTVNASATAAISSIGSSNQVIPIGLDSTTTYKYGQNLNMLLGGSGQGRWNALNPCGSGGADVRTALSAGVACNPGVAVGNIVDIKQGVTVGPIRQGIQSRVDAGESGDPSGTWNNHSLDDPRAATLMLVNWLPDGKTVQVVGFAEIWIVGPGPQGQIQAIFIRQVTSGGPGGTIDAGAMHVSLTG